MAQGRSVINTNCLHDQTEHGWKPTTCVVQLIFLLYTEHAVGHVTVSLASS